MKLICANIWNFLFSALFNCCTHVLCCNWLWPQIGEVDFRVTEKLHHRMIGTDSYNDVSCWAQDLLGRTHIKASPVIVIEWRSTILGEGLNHQALGQPRIHFVVRWHVGSNNNVPFRNVIDFQKRSNTSHQIEFFFCEHFSTYQLFTRWVPGG